MLGQGAGRGVLKNHYRRESEAELTAELAWLGLASGIGVVAGLELGLGLGLG